MQCNRLQPLGELNVNIDNVLLVEPLAASVSRIGLVSQERHQQIQAILLRMAQGGQLRNKVTEAQLIDLLDQASSVRINSSFLCS